MPPRVREELKRSGVDSTDALVKNFVDKRAELTFTGSPIMIGISPEVATGTTAVVPSFLGAIILISGLPTSRTVIEGG